MVYLNHLKGLFKISLATLIINLFFLVTMWVPTTHAEDLFGEIDGWKYCDNGKGGSNKKRINWSTFLQVDTSNLPLINAELYIDDTGETFNLDGLAFSDNTQSGLFSQLYFKINKIQLGTFQLFGLNIGGNLIDETFPIDGLSAPGWTKFGLGTKSVSGGEYKTESVGGSDGAFKTFASQTEIWAEFDFLVESGFTGFDPTEDITGSGLSKGGSAGNRFLFGLRHKDGVIKYQFHPQENGGGFDFLVDPADFPFVPDQKVRVLMYYKVASAPGANDGIAKGWIDGKLLLDVRNLNNDALDVDSFTVGTNNGTGAMSITIRNDNIKVGTTSDKGIQLAWSGIFQMDANGIMKDTRGHFKMLSRYDNCFATGRLTGK